ncbi:MAG: Deoxyribose-phosphate aldolase [candidate division TA06 bacterium 32_111]|uniref:Deoxyribose-phosphate aldolase n=2 Tax=Bacteria candidate phyla TaxID=1783234 RepID=A0A101I3Q7_UNCT6|nr:MAG: Deoxyribose-phosphate aldolase [candidate division TA06 bacterium 32_111]KUK87824.1 MAG: Deoxyribose-phosphate aldolase [candidate division TA06 bacterium 34_109]HAF07977.1 deoxyribose-phosphate aldolase [candidate division WOR-3 bacterium]HCP16321.1 deoxyribose-phosphate aldolase [candidate division WOR-3 bacterium]
MRDINRFIDHTLLKADATFDDIKRLCEEARRYNFFSVCVNQVYVNYSKELLKNSDVKVCTVVGFPLGATDIETKIFETKRSLQLGADEIDMVMNIGYMKSKMYERIVDEIKCIKEVCKNKVLKVIVETCLLTEDEKREVVKLLIEGKADFIKTSTGFSTGGAKVEDIKLFKSIAGNRINIKASGGIRDLKSALDMIENGATRIGSSNSVKIMGGDL